MKPNFLIVIFQLFFISLFGQFEDDFSNDLSNWQGDLSSFSINSDNQLQLDAPSPGTSIIFTQADIPDSTAWELYFQLNLKTTSFLLKFMDVELQYLKFLRILLFWILDVDLELMFI